MQASMETSSRAFHREFIMDNMKAEWPAKLKGFRENIELI